MTRRVTRYGGRAARCVAVAAAGLLALTACGSSGSKGSTGSTGSAAQAKPVDVYAIEGETGPYAASAKAIEAGIKAAVAVVNRSGGILGRPVKVTFANDQSDPTQTVSLLTKRLQQSSKPDLIFPGTGTANSQAAAPLAMQAGIISMSAGSGSLGDPTKFPLYFGTAPTQDSQAAFLVSQLSAKGYKKVAFLASDDPAARSWLAKYTSGVTGAGMTVVGSEFFPSDAIDMTPELQKLKGSKPDVVVLVGGLPGTTPSVLKSREKAAMMDVPVFGDLTSLLYDVASSVTPAQLQGFSGILYKCTIQGEGGSGTKDLIDELKKENVTFNGTLSVYGHGWDWIMQYANAVTAANSFDAQKLKATLEAGPLPRKFKTVYSDTYGWSSTSHFSDAKDVYAVGKVGQLVDGQYPAS